MPLRIGNTSTKVNGKRVQVTVEREKRNRTNQQNKYYWGYVLQLLSEHTGHEPEDLHEALKAHFAPKQVVGNIVIPSATRYLDTIDFSVFVEKVVLQAVIPPRRSVTRRSSNRVFVPCRDVNFTNGIGNALQFG